MSSLRGWWLLDVDGVLNPDCNQNKPLPGYCSYRYFPSDGTWRTAHEAKKEFRTHELRPSLLVWLRPGLGAVLCERASRLGLRLAWATTWGEEANRLIGPTVGLPSLPVVPVREEPGWKYRAVSEFVRPDEPVVWFDDGFAPDGDLDRDPDREDAVRNAWLNIRKAPTLLHQVDPRMGVVEADLDAVATWVNSQVG